MARLVKRPALEEVLAFCDEDPIERVFILTAVVGFIALEVWLVFFAGSPLDGKVGP